MYVSDVTCNTIPIVEDWGTMGGCGNAIFPNDIWNLHNYRNIQAEKLINIHVSDTSIMLVVVA